MGLFSFLFGGKKKAKTTETLATPVIVETVAPAAPVVVSVAPAMPPGVAQAKLRLKLAASLRTGQHAAAYEAAQGLADIQMRAGRKMIARTWQQQAERIKAAMYA